MDHEKRQEHAGFSNTSNTTSSATTEGLSCGLLILTMAIAASPWFLLLGNPGIASNVTALFILVIGAWVLASLIAVWVGLVLMRVDQHARIQEPLGIERVFGGPQCGCKKLWAFLVVPLAVIAANRVVVSNCSASLSQRG